MEFLFLGVITVAAVTGAVLELLVARENYVSSSRLVSMIPQRSLLRSSRELVAGTALLVLSVAASLLLLIYEHNRSNTLEQQVSQLQLQLQLAKTDVRAPSKPEIEPIAEAAVIDESPIEPTPIEDRQDLARIDPTPEPVVESRPGTWRVSVPSLNLRTTPNGSVIRSLRRGHRVQIVREQVVEQKRWVLVQSQELDVKGWVSRAFIANTQG